VRSIVTLYGWEGPARSGENLLKSITSSEIDAGAALPAASVHAVLPDLDAHIADLTGYVRVKIPHQKLNALELQLCTQFQFFCARHWQPPSMGQSCHRSCDLLAWLAPFDVMVVVVARTRSPAILTARSAMLDPPY
jgi:hypothetical protein